MIHAGNNIVYPTYDARDNSILATGWDGNVWLRIPLGSTSAGSMDASDPTVLFQNRPNPFTFDTSIGFALPAVAHTRLDVLDVRGSRVATLMDQTRGPGRHSVAWDGRNDSGERAASGMYYFRLSVDGRDHTRKAMLLR